MKYRGTGTVKTADFKEVSFTGKTKAGNPIKITLHDAINLGNIDWTFADKDEVVPEITFTATYSNTNSALTDKTEPWDIDFGTLGGNASDNILVGSGVLKIGENPIALVRGGGQFTVTRTFRNIAADGDMGPVKDRISLDESVATFKINALTILNSFADVYAGIETVE